MANQVAFFLTWDQVQRLKAKGVRFASILQGAGIFSTGCEKLDARLPLPEWFDIPADTKRAVAEAKENGLKVIALGTTVVRALESAVDAQSLWVGSGIKTFRIGSQTRLKAVNALISGLDAPGASHLELSKAFCSQNLLERDYGEAIAGDNRDHEFGDLSFLSCFGARD